MKFRKHMSKFFYGLLYRNLCYKAVFYRIEIHETVLKKPVRIEYLFKRKPRGALAEKLVLTEGSHRRGR